MTIYDLLILQIIAHLLADFTFQKEAWVKDKIDHGFKSKYLLRHTFIVLIFSLILSFQFKFIVFSLVIALFHYLIDGFKKKLSIQGNFKDYTFFIDQTIHILVIVGSVLLFKYYFLITPLFIMPITTHQLLIIAGFVLCTKPANIFIKAVFDLYKLKLPDDQGNDLLNAGKLIGNLERMLTLTLLLYGEFEAVGFLIAAKSILRYEGLKTSKTEYVLIGTFLSFGLAILTYVIINQVNM